MILLVNFNKDESKQSFIIKNFRLEELDEDSNIIDTC